VPEVIISCGVKFAVFVVVETGGMFAQSVVVADWLHPVRGNGRHSILPVSTSVAQLSFGKK
jgi:hypothetical protein